MQCHPSSICLSLLVLQWTSITGRAADATPLVPAIFLCHFHPGACSVHHSSRSSSFDNSKHLHIVGILHLALDIVATLVEPSIVHSFDSPIHTIPRRIGAVLSASIAKEQLRSDKNTPFVHLRLCIRRLRFLEPTVSELECGRVSST